MNTAVFLGGGRITRALIAGLRLAKSEDRIVVHDRHARKLRQLRQDYKVIAESNLHRAVEQADLLIIAVRPASVAELLHQIGEVRRGTLIVSLAAGVPLAKLGAGLKVPALWARAMPSPVCRSGHGFTAVTFDRKLPGTKRRAIKKFFARVGKVVEIPESQFDVFTATFSCSHGYHAVATLAKAAQAEGLEPRTALMAAAHALADGIVAWREGAIPLDRLLHEAATPGGIAATVMTSMRDAGHDRAVAQGLRAGIARARRHSKG
ncbi:MAG TPA: NAD(P)-binding domain-containing protein [Terriglobales bacterium]|nr:NAD(P)-binding domain-containing protein [Terriglobales bacterium]